MDPLHSSYPPTPAPTIQCSSPYFLSLLSHCSHLNSLPFYLADFLSISGTFLAASCYKAFTRALLSPSFSFVYSIFVF